MSDNRLRHRETRLLNPGAARQSGSLTELSDLESGAARPLQPPFLHFSSCNAFSSRQERHRQDDWMEEKPFVCFTG